MIPKPLSTYPVVLFDGVCHLCHGAVRFILKRDKKKRFRFATLTSDYASALFHSNEMLSRCDSVLLVDNDRIYMKSSAVLRIFRILGGWYSPLYVLILLPRFIRDRLYDWIAANRYRWFGKYDHCMIPSHDVQDLFIR